MPLKGKPGAKLGASTGRKQNASKGMRPRQVKDSDSSSKRKTKGMMGDGYEYRSNYAPTPRSLGPRRA